MYGHRYILLMFTRDENKLFDVKCMIPWTHVHDDITLLLHGTQLCEL